MTLIRKLTCFNSGMFSSEAVVLITYISLGQANDEDSSSSSMNPELETSAVTSRRMSNTSLHMVAGD